MNVRLPCCVALWLLALPGCASDPPVFEEVPPAEELYESALLTLEGRYILFYHHVKYTEAIEELQAIIDNYPYSEYAVLAELKIADAYFDNEKYDEALSYYRDFGDLHPQHERVPYTIFQSALCFERQVRPTNRDQTPTRDALQYLDQLLNLYPHSEYAANAEFLWRDLRARLAQNVVGIAEFYLSRREYESAAARYRSLLNEYPGLGFDAQALYKLGVCYSAMNRDEEAQQIFQSVIQNYEESEYADDAEDRIRDTS